MELISKSCEETIEYGSEFGKSLKGGEVVILTGSLGCGKTVFTKGIARALDITENVTSPSFSIMNIYRGSLDLYHFDFYRIENRFEMDDLLAFKKRKCYNPAITFIRSRRQEVYTACYKEGKRDTDYLVLNRVDFLEFIKEKGPEYIISSENDYRSVISQDDINVKKIFTYPSARDAVRVAEEQGLKPEKKYLKPMYGRNF